MIDNEWPQSIRPYRAAPPVNSVGVVMPMRDGLKFFKLAFHALINFTDYHYMMSIVDNLSSEPTKNLLQTIGHNHKVNVFDYSEVNRSASINLAMRQMFTCGGINFGCVISQDAIVEPNWLSRLMHFILTENQIGLVAPATNIGCAAQTDRGIIGRVSRADSVSGGCLLFRKQAYLTANGFDESLHGGYEDLDFCERVKRKGYVIGVDGRVYVHRFHTTPEYQLSSEYERKESERKYLERYPQPKTAERTEEKQRDRLARA